MASLLRKDFQLPSPTPEEVREHLRALLARKEFTVSERNRRFLSYVVGETLDGRADRIKAYNIALAAFGRGEDFDPLNDPIVRIEAGRLRRARALLPDRGTGRSPSCLDPQGLLRGELRLCRR